jgi:hypothetical protein
MRKTVNPHVVIWFWPISLSLFGGALHRYCGCGAKIQRCQAMDLIRAVHTDYGGFPGNVEVCFSTD